MEKDNFISSYRTRKVSRNMIAGDKSVIWILNHYAASPDMAGGTRHYDLAQELIVRGYEVVIFASGFLHGIHTYVKFSDEENYLLEDHNGVKFVWFKTTPYKYNNWRRIMNMISYGIAMMCFNRNFKKPDIIIGSTVHPIAPLVGWWLSRKYKARFIFEVRDLWPQTMIDMGAMKKNSLTARMLYIWEKFMYHKAKKVIVLLPKAKEYIIGLGINSEKITWLPNGVVLQRFNEISNSGVPPDIIKIIDKKKDKFKVLYAGAHGQANGLDIIIETAALIEKIEPDIHFFFVGDGPEKVKLVKKTNERALDNVTFLEPVPKSNIASILLQAELLLFSLLSLDVYKYGISLNKLYDYLASGRPVIMAGSATNRIVEVAGAGIIVEPDNPEALAKGIIKLKQMSPEERKRMGDNGRLYVEKYHNIKNLGEKLAQILEEVISGN